MANQPDIIPSPTKFELLRDTYGFSPADGVELPTADSMITSPPHGKVSVYLKTFDASLCLPLTNFQQELLQKNGCNT